MARVVIAAGGTGGHLYPALSLASALRDRGHDVSFVGGDRLEARLVPEAGFELHALPAVGMPRAASPRALVAAGKFLWSVAAARLLLRRLLPDAVVGMGGYASAAPALASRVPVVIHEQNARLTLGNRVSSLNASVLALSLPLVSEGPRVAYVEMTGNPLRREIAELASCTPEERAQRRLTARAKLGLRPDGQVLLAFGGSQGALAVNEALPGALRVHPDIEVLHIAGPAHAGAATGAWEGSARARVLPYLDAMEDAFAAADVVVSRSGATTVAELCALGIPAVLVPYPHGGYQKANAASLERGGAALVVEQGGDRLSAGIGEAVGRLVSDDGLRARLSSAAASLGRPDATGRLAGLVERTFAD